MLLFLETNGWNSFNFSVFGCDNIEGRKCLLNYVTMTVGRLPD